MRSLGLGGAELGELSATILGRGGAFCFQAIGASMSPWIRDGDLLTVQPVDAEALRVGDVALYRTDGRRIAAHRIVARRTEGGCSVLTARGDAALGPGELLQAEQVLGRVVHIQRGARTLDLDRAPRRAVARLWVATAPLGPLLLRSADGLKQFAAWLLRRLQGWGPFRAWVRTLIGRQTRYRVATAEDAPALSALYGYRRIPELANPERTWSQILSGLEGNGYALVASVGSKLVGATILSRAPEQTGCPHGWWLENMTVSLRYRGAGIGQGLVLQALEAAQEAGATSVYLRVRKGNRAATGLYRKIGFRPAPATERRPDRDAEVEGTLLVYHF